MGAARLSCKCRIARMSMEQEGLAPFTASDGVTLFRRVYEPAGEPLGELLFGHGLGENSSRYVQAARAFAAAGWRTTTWDLRGHGRSDGPRTYVKEFRRFHLDLAEQVSELQRSGRRVVVVSHSLGGLIAFGAVAGLALRRLAVAIARSAGVAVTAASSTATTFSVTRCSMRTADQGEGANKGNARS